MKNGSSLYHTNALTSQGVKKKNITPGARYLPPRKVSDVETCDESSLSGR